MEAIDITGLSSTQIQAIENDQSTLVRSSGGLLRPKGVKAAKFTKDVTVKDTIQNKKLLARYGEKIFTCDGKVNFKAMPVDDLCKKLMRRSVPSRMDLFDNLGEKYTKSLLKRIPKTSLKLKSKVMLKNNIRKFLGWKPEKSNVQKGKEKTKKSGKRKSDKKHKEEGPANVE